MTTYFTTDHEWIRVDADIATVGITDGEFGLVSNAAGVVLEARGGAARRP